MTRSITNWIRLALILTAATSLAAGAARAEPPTPPSEHHMSDLELAVLNEVNFARTHPQDYARRLAAGRRTAATDDAIAFLERQPALSALTPAPTLASLASAHAADQGPRGGGSPLASDGSNPIQRMQAVGAWSTIYAEAISLGYPTADGVVSQLIIDSASPTHAGRADLFNPLLVIGGVGCGPNRAYRSMCVIDMTGAPTAASAPANDCGGAFYDRSGHELKAPPEPHSASSDAALKLWIGKVKTYFAEAYATPGGAPLDAGKVKACTDWRIKREIRADDTVAEGLARLEQSGAADAPLAH
jgi:uncharacterized protein YkwD